ncbi:MAG: bile acid:sodium symporter family protein, partial [Gammaproteobacteria bacterium]|nr:bile acid:sodium symporter family protein [Gammaproteobacteria bacterium]
LGVALHYLIMPPAAWLISRLFNLPVELMVGMVLVGSSAGGTASNVICYLAKGNVALSITLTLTSTLLAVFAMPALTWLYAGQSVPVPALAMLFSILKIVLIPVLLGVIVNSLFRQRLAKVVALFPFISSLAIIMIIAIIVALNNNTIATMGMVIMWAVILHNLTGLFAGYMIARKLGHDAVISRTLAIEVGMQNSGLSVALATKYFTASAALPGALFSVWHNISGSVLAAWWARQK